MNSPFSIQAQEESTRVPVIVWEGQLRLDVDVRGQTTRPPMRVVKKWMGVGELAREMREIEVDLGPDAMGHPCWQELPPPWIREALWTLAHAFR